MVEDWCQFSIQFLIRKIEHMKWIYFLTLISFVAIACNDSQNKNESAKTEPISSSADEELSAVDTTAECESDGNFENPNGNSELALLMKKMDEQLRENKQALKDGAMPSLDFEHAAIKTAESTKEGIMDDTYMAYASAYLNSVEQYKNAPQDSLIDAHNMVITNCISCHKSYCTGPISRIKKLRVKPKATAAL